MDGHRRDEVQDEWRVERVRESDRRSGLDGGDWVVTTSSQACRDDRDPRFTGDDDDVQRKATRRPGASKLQPKGKMTEKTAQPGANEAVSYRPNLLDHLQVTVLGQAA